MRRIASFSFALVVLLFSTGTLRAQSAAGQITGTVKDASGAVMIGAKVTVQDWQTGICRTTTTSESGAYVFPLMPVGLYTVTAEQQGFTHRPTRGRAIERATRCCVLTWIWLSEPQRKPSMSREQPWQSTPKQPLSGRWSPAAR